MHVQIKMGLITFRFCGSGTDLNKLCDIQLIFFCAMLNAKIKHTADRCFQHMFTALLSQYQMDSWSSSTPHLSFRTSSKKLLKDMLCFEIHTPFAHCQQMQGRQLQCYKSLRHRTQGDVSWLSSRRCAKLQHHAYTSLFLLFSKNEQRKLYVFFLYLSMIHQIPVKLLHPMMKFHSISSDDAKWFCM